MSTDVTFDKLLLEASDLLFQGNVVSARSKINKALSRKPGEPRALTLLANILTALKDHAGAIAIYSQLLREFSEEPALHLKLGAEYLSYGDLKMGVTEVEFAIGYAPENTILIDFYEAILDVLNCESNEITIEQFDFSHMSDDLIDVLHKVIVFIKKSTDNSYKNAIPAKKITDILDMEENRSKSTPVPQIEEKVEDDIIADTPIPEIRSEKKNSKKLKISPILNTPSSQKTEKLNNLKEEQIEDGIVKHMPSYSEIPSVSETDYIADSEPISSTAESFVELNFITQRSFSFTPTCLFLALDTNWIIRENLLLCWYMDIEKTVIKERGRGSSSSRAIKDKLTGKLLEIEGKGSLTLNPSDKQKFFGFTLDNAPLYIREDLVVAFESQLKWENGWLRGDGNKIAMISFRGVGKVFIQLPDTLYTTNLPEEEFLSCSISKLVGWDGYVVAQCQSKTTIQAAGTGHLLLKA
jgi:Mitochondrial biogenesis AIM24/Tetratricopeptide repeat